MKMCDYCYSKNTDENINCYHCNAPLDQSKRKIKRSTKSVDPALIHSNYDVLKELNIIELRHLFLIAREEKNKYYIRGSLEQSSECIFWLKQIQLIENLILDSAGYIPFNTNQTNINRSDNLRKKSIASQNEKKKIAAESPDDHYYIFRKKS